MSNFSSKAELFSKSCLTKQFHQQLNAWLKERNGRESYDISYFFQLHLNSCLCERRKKIYIASPMQLF